MSVRNYLALAAFVSALAVNLHGSLRAEESAAEKEAKQAADEDSAEKQLSEEAQNGKQYSGRFMLDLSDTSIRDVVGSFSVEHGPKYLVKASDPALVRRLVARDAQKCVLFGKLRNNGKYLLVTSIVEAAPPPTDRHKRGGM